MTEALTAREGDVWAYLARGLTNSEIGRELGIATSTVNNHVAQVLQKLGVPNRTCAATAWHAHGGQDAPPPLAQD